MQRCGKFVFSDHKEEIITPTGGKGKKKRKRRGKRGGKVCLSPACTFHLVSTPKRRGNRKTREKRKEKNEGGKEGANSVACDSLWRFTRFGEKGKKK